MTPDEMPEIEQMLTVADIAPKIRFSEDKVRRLFEGEPGVLKVGHPTLSVGRGYRRRYYSLRIPMSVFLRVMDRLQQPNQSPELRPSRRRAG